MIGAQAFLLVVVLMDAESRRRSEPPVTDPLKHQFEREAELPFSG